MDAISLKAWVDDWGNTASMVGLLVSIIGFIATLFNVSRSKTAAEKAEQAACATRNSLLFLDTIAELASAIAVMEEIKRLQRENAWRLLPDRYSALRHKLIVIKSVGTPLSDDQAGAIQATIARLAELEHKVDRSLVRNAAPANPAKFNEIVSVLLDELSVLLSTLQRQLRA